MKRACLLFIPVLLLCGCPGPARRPAPVCPGSADVAQSADILNAQSRAVRPLRASAGCVIEFSDADGKARRESFDAQLRFVPPDMLYIGADKFGPIRFGANSRQFWMYIKPGADAAWWGYRTDAADCAARFGLNPACLSEALGLMAIDDGWILTCDNGLDVLTRKSPEGRIEKRLYVERCRYRIKRIEYFDQSGRPAAAVDMADYRQIEGDFYVPSDIKLSHYAAGRTDSAIRLDLKSISIFEPTAAQLTGKLFERPSTRGFKQVYRLNRDCEFVPDGGQEQIE